MKKIYPIFLLLVVYLNVNAQRYLELMNQEDVNFFEVKREAEKYFENRDKGRGSGYKQYKRWEYIHQKEVDDNGFIIKASQVWNEQQRFLQEWQANSSIHTRGGNNKSLTGNWQNLGPFDWNRTSGWNPGVGRIVCIDVDDNNQNVIYVGSPTGGLWKTTDGGSNWSVLTDNFPVMDIWSVEIDPSNSNIVYMGTAGGGILKTMDGGNTWNQTGNISGTIRDILVHPTNNNIVFAAKSHGIYRSTNGGANWTRVSTVRAEDIMFKPGNSNTIYACGRSFQRSTDGGLTWSVVSSGIVANERMKMAVTPANPDYIYIVQKSGNVFGRVYRSTDSGQSFSIRAQNNGNNTNYLGYEPDGTSTLGQASRDMAISVSPSNANEVLIAGIIIFKSTDGGANYSALTDWHLPNNIGYVHADVEVLMHVGNTIYTGTDGGIYKSTDNGANFTDLSAGLGIRQFYRMGCSQTDPDVVSGGSQDNGTSLMRGPSRQWVDWLGADGMETFVDHSNANIIYGTSQFGSMYKSIDQGNSSSSLFKPSGVGNGEWVTPFEIDPVNPNTIYVGFNQLYKSTSGGAGGPSNWTAISNFSGLGKMDEICIAPSDPNTIYVAFGPQVFATYDGGINWINLNEPWGGIVNYISVDPNDPLRVAVVVSGSAKAFISSDGGNTWTNITLNLPNIGANCILLDGEAANGIYIGMQSGVYYKDDAMASWMPYLTGLPKVRVEELEIVSISGKIRAATYGRGLWESDVFGGNNLGLPPDANFFTQTTTTVINTPIQFYDNSTGTPTSWNWSFPGANPSSSTLENPIVTYPNPGSYDVSLIVSNSNGSDTLSQSNYINITTYCIPNPIYGTTYDDYIDGVSIGSINNLNTGSNSGPAYNDYTSLSTDLSIGSSESITIISGGYSNDMFAAWIDFNQDNDFDDPGEKLGEVTCFSSFQTLNIPFIIPAGAAMGNTTMRIRCVWDEPNMNACSDYYYGETEDYSVNITAATACVPTYSVGTSAGDFIDGVIFGNMANMNSGALGGPNYNDYSTLSCEVEKGMTHDLTIIGGSYFMDDYAAWIDWNRDGDFDDLNEKLGQFRTSFPYEINNISVPISILVDTGVYDLRIRCAYNAQNMSPCAHYTWGETEDYQIHVIPSNDLCNIPVTPIALNDSTCGEGILNLGIQGTSNNYYWYHSIDANSAFHKGSNFSTGLIDSTKTYYVAANAEDTGQNITTFFASNNGSNGNLFNIESGKNIRVEGFSINLSGNSSKEVAIYYRLGGYEGFETSPQAWTLLGKDTVVAQGNDIPTFVNVGGLEIGQEETYGILIHTTQGGIRYASMSQDSLIANDDIIIESGKGMGNLFGSVFPSRIWNGIVHYTKYAGCESARVPVTAKVNPIPQVKIDSLPDFCQSDSLFALNANHIGGMYSGSGVISGHFNPQLAGSGSHEIVYTYTSPLGCSNSDTVQVTVNSDPLVTFSNFNPVCENSGEIHLSGGQPAGGVYSGTGISNGVFNPESSGTGTYVITYTYTGQGGCSSSTTSTIEVLPIPNVSLTSNLEFCEGDTAQVINGGLPLGGNYFGPGISGTSFDPNLASIGNHVVNYTFQDTNGCADTASALIPVHALPMVSSSAVYDFCENGTVTTLFGGSPIGGIYTGPGVNAGSFDPQVSGVGIFPITYSYTDTNGCSDSVVFTVDVNANPAVTFDTLFEFCADEGIVHLKGGIPAGGNYFGTAVSGQYFDPSVSGTGSFEIHYSYSDANGCSGIDSSYITVHDLPYVNLSDLGSICENKSSMTLNAGVPAGGFYSGNAIDNGIFDPLAAGQGIHLVYYYYSDSNGCENSDSSFINVKTAPSAYYGYSSYQTEYLFSDSSLDAQNLTWDFGDGDSSFSKNPVHNYAAPGNYNVCLTAENDGCTDEYCEIVTAVTGLNRIIDINDIHVFPNPFTDQLSYEIATPYNGKTTFEIFDIRGIRVLYEEKDFNNGFNAGMLVTSDLAQGTYILKITDARGSATQKLEKVR